jgi:hypothetical protein
MPSGDGITARGLPGTVARTLYLNHVWPGIATEFQLKCLFRTVGGAWLEQATSCL